MIVMTWLEKKELVPISSTLSPAQPDDVVEYDEMWSFVHDKNNRQWLWIAINLAKRTPFVERR